MKADAAGRAPRFVFGPVPSRRLGRSLGIDPIPLKTCNWNCVYCQLGRTRPLCNERRAYYPAAAILAEVEEALARVGPGEIDYITFVGSGEPTLHSELGWLIAQVKALSPLPVAVISNGALLYQPEVRRALAAAAAVLPSLDAGTPDLYRRLNRPHPEVTFARLLGGLIAFRHQYTGHLWVEVMLVRGLNDGEAELLRIAAALRQIRPDEVHISLPTRPPAETWVQPSTAEGLMRAQAILGDVARLLPAVPGDLDLRDAPDPLAALTAIIIRHPLPAAFVVETLARSLPERKEAVLAALARSDRIQLVERYGEPFWCAASGFYPDPIPSDRVDPRQDRRDGTRIH